MPQPVKLSDDLIEAARSAAEDADRSIAGQVEHWTRLGRAVEAALTVGDAQTLKRSRGEIGREMPEAKRREVLLGVLRLAVNTAGVAHLGALPKPTGRPRYGTDPAFPGFLVRVEPDGRRTPGRFVNRRFIPLEAIASVRT